MVSVEKFESEASARVAELNETVRPLMSELQELQSALDAIRQRKNGQSEAAEQEQETPAPQPQRRKRRGGTRADQFVKIVSENPGITVSEIGRKMRLNKPNYLYRVAEQVTKEGRVKKEDKGYVVKA